MTELLIGGCGLIALAAYVWFATREGRQKYEEWLPLHIMNMGMILAPTGLFIMFGIKRVAGL